jgi:thiol-disulfide isomerase/thioredoxin
MNFKPILTSLITLISIPSLAQDASDPTLKISDDAPPLYIKEWVKGEPIKEYEKGKVYIVEFWATWCKPCIAAMPHLSELKRKNKDQLEIIGVSVFEDKNTTSEDIKEFVLNMGEKMDYHVAIDDNNKMIDNWFNETNDNNGIPKSFVIDQNSKLAWFGHPKDLEPVINKILAGEWELQSASKEKNEEKNFKDLEVHVLDSMNNYIYELNAKKLNESEINQKTLDKINEFIVANPELENTPIPTFYIMQSLLSLDPKKAYEYGNSILTSKEIVFKPAWSIVEVIRYHENENKSTLPPEIYLLGAKAFQEYIDQSEYQEVLDLPKLYKNISDWYLKANEEQLAKEALQKANLPRQNTN